MRIAYCDDEKVQLDYMEHLLVKWSEKSGVPCEYTAYHSAKELLFENPERIPFHLLILDIDMQDMDGMELARDIRKRDKTVPILFLTNRKEYVFEGYEVNALRYILKPISEEKLAPVLQELAVGISEEKQYLVENIEGEMQKIPLESILFAEAEGHYVHLHTVEGVYTYKKNISELEKEIGGMPGEGAQKPMAYICTHRSFLVNLAYVERVTRTDCVLCDGNKVPVSRNSYKAVNDAFISFYKER